MTYGEKVKKAIFKLRKTIKPLPNEADYKFAERFCAALRNELNLKVLAQTDLRSTDSSPHLNITVWTEKGREIKNPDLRGFNRVNFFYA